MEFVPTDLPDLLGSGVWPLLKRFGPGLMGLCLGIFLLISVGRRSRRYLRPDEPLGDQGWALHDLRRLHAEGQLEDAEYQRLRARELGLSIGNGDSRPAAEAATPATNTGRRARSEADEICPQCKHLLKGGEKYCSTCGMAVKRATAES